jgi:hypothetical protein
MFKWCHLTGYSKTKKIRCKSASVSSHIKVDRYNVDEVFFKQSEVVIERHSYNFVTSGVWSGTRCDSVPSFGTTGHVRAGQDLEQCKLVLLRDNSDRLFQV